MPTLSISANDIPGLVRALKDALQHKYGLDYAFLILARGEIIGASSYKHGVVMPETAEVIQ